MALFGVAALDERDAVHRDGETVSIRPTLTQTNSHNHNLTGMLVDETPDINSDYKDFLLVFHAEVL